MKQLVEAYI